MGAIFKTTCPKQWFKDCALNLKNRRLISAVLIFTLIPQFMGCGTDINYDIDSVGGRQAIIDHVNLALTEENCASAIVKIELLYNSKYVDNEIRMLRSSAYMCKAGASYFGILNSLLQNITSLASGLWATMTKMFSSTSDDDKMEAAMVALDTLMSVRKAGAIVPEQEKGEGPDTELNPRALYYKDREDDANTYLFYSAMTVIGMTQFRYGKNDSEAYGSSYYKKKDLPWVTSDLVMKNQDGCAYASAIVNFFDSVAALKSSITKTELTERLTVLDTFTSLIDYACYYGCMGSTALNNLMLIDFNTGCTLTAAQAEELCYPCPRKLRYRYGCTESALSPEKVPAAENYVACAAAGIVTYINDERLTGWPSE